MMFASTPRSAVRGRGRYLAAGVGWGREHRPNPALLDFRALHGGKRGEAMQNAAVAWHASLSTMVMAGVYGYLEGAHARQVLVRLAALCAESTDPEPGPFLDRSYEPGKFGGGCHVQLTRYPCPYPAEAHPEPSERVSGVSE